MHAEAPNYAKILVEDLVGVTAILLTASYNEQEFFRVGYYLSNMYEDPVLIENPPEKPDLSKLVRHILVDQPRITRFQIEWGEKMMDENTNTLNQVEQVPDASLMEKGTQLIHRQEMMSTSNLAQAASCLNPGVAGPSAGGF